MKSTDIKRCLLSLVVLVVVGTLKAEDNCEFGGLTMGGSRECEIDHEGENCGTCWQAIWWGCVEDYCDYEWNCRENSCATEIPLWEDYTADCTGTYPDCENSVCGDWEGTGDPAKYLDECDCYVF